MLWRVLPIMLSLAFATPPTKPASPQTTLRVRVYGAGGPKRSARHPSTLPNVAVRITTLTATPVVEGRTKSNGLVVFHLNPGKYWVSGYLTPPGVVPETFCEKKLVNARPSRAATVRILCPLR
jgi:hypothetical protein